MARLLGVLCLAVVSLTLVANTAVTQDKKSKAKTPLPKGFKDVGLSAEQDAKARAIMAEFDAKVKKLQDEIKGLKQQETTEMTKLLTSEQKEKLTKILLGDDSKKVDTKKEDKK